MNETAFVGLNHSVFFRCVEDSFEPVMVTDKTGVLRYVNPAWTLTYGYSKAEALGKNPRILRSENQNDEFYRIMWGEILDPSIGFWRGEVVNCAKDGHLVPVLLTITPYRNNDGEIVGYMGIAVDLTEQKRMEQQILRQDRLASIGLLAGGLAHEIGNPLGVIRGRAEFLMMQSQEPSVSRGLEVIVNQIDRISGLIRSLLRVSRVPEEIALHETNLETVVSEVAILMSESCRQNHIELRLENLRHIVFAEPSHLQQLLLNLVINSTHAIQEQISKSPDTSIQHFIEISAQLVDDEKYGPMSFCALKVTDSGCGIPNLNLKKLFQPFFTTKESGQGTGMGLAIVAKLIDEMNGRVVAESPGTGLGATFTLYLQASGSSPRAKER
jgi:PAS domain S-box-containing protein